MKNLTVFIKSLAIVFALVLMTSCSSKKDEFSSKIFVLEGNGYKAEATVYYEGDSIKKLVTKETISYGTGLYQSKEASEKILKSAADMVNAVKGISFEYTCDEDKAFTTSTFNLSDIDYEKAKEVPLLNTEPLISSTGKMKLSEYEKLLKAGGFVEKNN